MIQCFVKKEYEAPFALTRMPRLFSVSRTDEEASAHPRIMLPIRRKISHKYQGKKIPELLQCF